MDLEFKSATTGVKVLDEGEGIVQAIVSVTEIVDQVNDRIIPGAYGKTLQKRSPKGLRGHDWQRMVAKTLHAEELRPGDRRIGEISEKIADLGGGGLLIRGQYNLGTQLGRDAYEDARFFGDEMEWSVGYKVPKGKSAIAPRTGTREIKEMDLYEWSDVAFGAAPLTAGTTSVKSAISAMIEEGVLSTDEIIEWAELAGIKNLGAVCQVIEEKKARTVAKVRTAEGARHFNRPINSPITRAPNKPRTLRLAHGPAQSLGPNVKGHHYLPSGMKVTIHEYHDLDPAPIRTEIKRAGGLRKWITTDLNESARLIAYLVAGLHRPTTDMRTAYKSADGGHCTPEDDATLTGIVATVLQQILVANPDLSDDDLPMVIDECAAALRSELSGGKADGEDLEDVDLEDVEDLDLAVRYKDVLDALDDALESADADDADIEEKRRRRGLPGRGGRPGRGGGRPGVREVASEEGRRRYGLPIGSPIKPGQKPVGGSGNRATRRAGGERGKKPKTPPTADRATQRAASRHVEGLAGAARIERPVVGEAEDPEATLVQYTGKGFGADLTPQEREAINQLNPDYPGLTAGDDSELVETDDIEEALEALHNNKRVRLSQPKQVATLLERLNSVVKDAKVRDKAAQKKWVASGRDIEDYRAASKAKSNPEKKAAWLAAGNDEADLDLIEAIPDYNLCNISVEGTNLFCAEHKGYTRLTMPQLAGKPRAGSRAADLLKAQNEQGRKDWVAAGGDPDEFEEEVEVNLADLYREHLATKGVKTTRKRQKASGLKATQQELVGSNVVGMMESMANTNPDGTPKDPSKTRNGKPMVMPPGRIYVSRDDYVLDGHHRWAAVVGMDLEDNVEGDLDMDVEVVDMDILQLMAATVEWTVEMGVEPKGGGAGSGGEAVATQEKVPEVTPEAPSKPEAAEKKDLGDLEGDMPELGADALVAADLVDADPDYLGALSDDAWGQLLDVLHGDDLAGVKSINDAVMAEPDADSLTAGDARARHLIFWGERLDAKIGLSDTALELIVDGLESKAKGHSSRIHPGLDRSPKENWVDKAGGLPNYIERIAKHLHSDRGMTISHAIAAAINRVKKWAAGTGEVSAATRAKAAKAVAQWEKMKAKTRAKKSAPEFSVTIDTGAANTATTTTNALITWGEMKAAEIASPAPAPARPCSCQETHEEKADAHPKENPSDTDPNEGGEMDTGLSAPGPGDDGEPMDDMDTDNELEGETLDDQEEEAQEGKGEGKVDEDIYAISGAYLAELADMNEKAGRVLSTNNSKAIRSALDQLVAVLNRAGIAWGDGETEGEGEGTVATKGSKPGRSGYPWGERSNTVVEDDDIDDEEEEEEDVEEEEPPADEEETDEDDEEDEEEKALLSLADLMDAANLRLTSPI